MPDGLNTDADLDRPPLALHPSRSERALRQFVMAWQGLANKLGYTHDEPDPPVTEEFVASATLRPRGKGWVVHVTQSGDGERAEPTLVGITTARHVQDIEKAARAIADQASCDRIAVVVAPTLPENVEAMIHDSLAMGNTKAGRKERRRVRRDLRQLGLERGDAVRLVPPAILAPKQN